MKYVHSYKNRHGKMVHYFRRGSLKIRLPAPDTTEFARAYLKAEASAGTNNVALDSGDPKERKNRVIIQQRRVTRKPNAGVYLLLLGSRIGYVGASKDMAARVASHRTNGRPFDRAFYIPASERERPTLERILIAQLKPEQNRAGIEPRTAIGKFEEAGLPISP